MRLTASVVNNTAAKAQAAIRAARAASRSSVPAAAQLFVDEAQINAPVLTGRLRSGIHAVQTEDADSRHVFAVTPTVSADNEYGFDPPYARRIEFGFVGTDKMGRNYHQAAQPYMRPAFDSQQDPAREAMEAPIRAAVQGVE